MTRQQLRLITLATSLICVHFVICSAQSSKPTASPRIGEIKNYPATGLARGCGNLYFFKAGAKMSDTTYVFLARGDGSNAWMNLNGRDVRLRQIKSAKPTDQKPRQYSYAYGQMRVSVVIKNFETAPDGREPAHMYRMTITVRKGGAVRVLHAVGDADC